MQAYFATGTSPGQSARDKGGEPAMNRNRLVVQVRHEPGHVIIAAAGEVDIFTVASLRETLFALARDGHPLIVDLNRITFIGAAGLGALVGAARRAAAHGASLHVVGVQPQARQLLQLTGLDRTLRLARTLAKALQPLPALPDQAVAASRTSRMIPVGGSGEDD
jgi:anti-sigma B factor antagonist